MRKWAMRLAVLAFALTVVAGAAWAGEMVGTFQKVDQDQRTVIFADGTQLWMPEGMPIPQLTEGTKVKATYEEKDGKNWVTKIEAASD
ncbi:MAG: DUF1344 domain-containing protein [Deltaproteobacteria bacterium]|nr:DUF1344 domain-containing protein [Deltaproteobacteria bacterium]MBI3077570.1 DUF1344 domain-containing protein [Deltaproteobacteria bacterium]